MSKITFTPIDLSVNLNTIEVTISFMHGDAHATTKKTHLHALGCDDNVIEVAKAIFAQYHNICELQDADDLDFDNEFISTPLSAKCYKEYDTVYDGDYCQVEGIELVYTDAIGTKFNIVEFE